MQFAHNNHEVYSEPDFETNPKSCIAETDNISPQWKQHTFTGWIFTFLDCIDSWVGSGGLLQQVGTRDVLYICTPDGGGYCRTTGTQVDTYTNWLH